ncbi:hypothetical protein LAZ67_1006465 [Cordylochernes scorpioides]|uniref:Reverse transcriptase n=1 Tax=Cordylochernes scorpioides TaxID=51811 RepID=A0ABY6K1T5_9ARAC|nr:hypothetical protein LAZ67_1006465 [Cordylochernes scorpioides]
MHNTLVYSRILLDVRGCTITTRNTVASQASHLMGLLERAIARWSPFTRGLPLVGRARAANSLVLSSILHHLHGYLPPETTVGRLQVRLARFVWGTSRVSWLPGRILARPVSDASAQEIKATRKNIAEARVQQALGTVDQCVYVECCPEFSRVQYVLALDKLLGGKNIIQLNKMNGHVLVGLTTKALAERLIEEGLEIEDTLLKTYPFRKRAERVIISNLPFFVEDAEIIAALKPYGQVTSIAPLLVNVAGFTMKDGRRELFILLNEGVKLERLPTRLNINHKGEILPAFLSYGVKCSRCQRQGHRRANCPQTPKRPEDVSEQAPSNTGAVKTGPAPTTPTADPPAAPIPATSPENIDGPCHVSPASPPPTTAKSVDKSSPDQSQDPLQDQRDTINFTPDGKSTKTKSEMKELLKQVPESIFAEIEKLGLEREPVIKALQSVPGLKNLLPFMSDTKRTALNRLARKLVVRIPGSNTPLYKRLSDETNKESLDYTQDLCLGYSAIVAPPAASRGSGLACLFVPGVALLRHRVLWPGCIDLVHLNVHGQKMAVINCHLSHAPHERVEQVGIISEIAVRDNAWVVGDLNIDGGPAGATYSASVEGLSNLLEQAALEDAATFFNLAHLPTRVADFEGRIHSSRLDRILLPAALVERAKSYSTRYYHLSDHRAVLLQLGSPPDAGSPSVAVVLRSAAAIEHLSSYIEDVELAAENLDDGELWSGSNRIKAEILAEIRSLHKTRPELEDDYVTRASRYIRARLEASSTEADYPSLPDLGRTLRLRRRIATIVGDEEGEIMGDRVLRSRALSFFRHRFAQDSAESRDGTACPANSSLPMKISSRLFCGGWFGASLVSGALPSSTRRGSICLVPKACGGPGLTGFRPITLPSTDYRALAAILLRRLRPHLLTLAIDCQTYAIPGRSPSWNIARVTDEVEIANAGRLPLAVVSVDLESAFDSLDRGFLMSLLVSLGLPPAFIRWIQLLYAGANAAVRVGEYHTAAFPLLNGVRQGCAVSAALFSLAITPLLRRLQSSLGEVNVIAYADDIVLMVRQEEHFGEVASIFQGFRCASGIRVNFRKSVGLWCGAWRARVDSPLDISWTDTSLRILGCDIRPRASAAMHEGHLLNLVDADFRRWAPFTRGLSLVGRARAGNCLVLSTFMHHLHGYITADSSISKLQARLVRFVWGYDRTAWLPAGLLSRPVSLGGFGLLDLGTQMRLTCIKGVKSALRGGLSAYSWLSESGAWLTPLPPGTWLPARRRRLLGVWEAASEILALNHRVLPPNQLLGLTIIGGCRFLRPPDLLAASQWVGARVGDLIGHGSPHLRVTRAALADKAALSRYTSRLLEENCRGSYRVNSIGEAIVLRGTATPFQRLTTRRMLERPRLAALPITQLLGRWLSHVSIPISISWSSLRRCAFSGHNADVAVRLTLHALPHPHIRPQPVSPASPADTSLRMLGVDIRPRASAAMQEGHLLDLVDAAFRRWAPFTRGLSLVGRARAANCLVLSTFMHHLHGYIPADSSISKLQAHSAPRFASVSAIAPIMIKMGEYAFSDGRREAFILLREGVRLDTLPTRLTIQSKGDTLSAFLSFGIKCSKCGKQGHRRANCPALARQGNSSPRQAASPTDARPLPPPPPPPQQPRRPTPAPATSASPVQPAKTSTEAPVTPSAPHPAEPRDLAQPAPVALPAPLAAPQPPETFPLDIEMSEEELTSTPSASPREKPALVQLQEHLKQSPNLSIDWDGLPGIDREDAQRLLTSKRKMEKRVPSLSKAQVAALDQVAETIKASIPDSNHTIRKTLQKTKGETNAFHLGSGQDLCLGYNAVILAHPVAISGSGLACVFGPGVAVLQQRILWPGHIALATIDVHGEEMTAIAVHLAHEPRERNRQLELLAATAAQEEEGACWIIGDFNIRDRGPSSSSSSDALAALLDLAALVDVATQFDAAHLLTRVAMHGDQVESNRLDRILVPAGVLDRVSIYATSHYHLSDHRLVLLQVGPPTTAVSSPTQPRLAAMLRSGLVLEHLAGYIRELEEDTAHDDDDGILWDRWTTIKAGLLAEARSLHDPRHAASDSYVYRARRYIAAQLEASSIRADYPSLPDLARAIRLRRPVSVIRDEQDNIIEGPELRRRAFATFQPRFASPTSDPAAGAAFIASSAPTTTREPSEEDPLHRPDISPSEIANAIEHLPRGKAPGWDGLPCELLVAFSEDFFAEALARVFAASRLRGALPPSTRRSSICLVPKARGGRGLDGYRPVALPSADYRVLAAILHRRLKPHLRTLVPECQTYAVPGRPPSWNIAMVTDAVEEATALGSPLAVMGVDLESAFDSLDRGFLESLRLPPAFRAWINILYAGADATIRAGGFYTTAFPLLNGLRQGCAVSAALFSIATGPLLRRLELTLGVGNVIAYADDIVLLFHRDEDFERVATVFEEYKQASGVGVNLRKSAGLWCGAWRNRGDSPLGASWSTTSIRVLGLDIAPRSTVAHREQHLLALLETACRRWTPFTRGLSLVGRARAANTLVGSTIQHHLHGYLPSPPTIAKLQARLARFVWGPDHTAWLPANVMARPVAIGGLGLLDLATQLQLACLKGVQVALRGGRNAFSWLVGGNSGEAWIHPPPDGTRLQPRRLRLLKLWEEASNILGLNHRAVPMAQLLDLPIIGGCRFLRPPDLLAPARWRGARIRDLTVEDHLTARPTRSALADAAALGAFCRRLTSENAVGFGAESAPSSSSLAAAVVLRGTAMPFLNGLTTRSARRALDRPRLAATPISRFTSRWSPTIGPPPSRIDWASLRRCAFSGHEADAALKLAFHALPHPAHPASVGPSCPACGSIDRSLGHRYWCCRSIRPLIREAFNIIGRPPDLQAWIFGGSGLEDDALSILASAKLRIYRYFVQVGLGEAVEDPLIAWSRTLQRRGLLPLSPL